MREQVFNPSSINKKILRYVLNWWSCCSSLRSKVMWMFRGYKLFPISLLTLGWPTRETLQTITFFATLFCCTLWLFKISFYMNLLFWDKSENIILSRRLLTFSHNCIPVEYTHTVNIESIKFWIFQGANYPICTCKCDEPVHSSSPLGNSLMNF